MDPWANSHGHPPQPESEVDTDGSNFGAPLQNGAAALQQPSLRGSVLNTSGAVPHSEVHTNIHHGSNFGAHPQPGAAAPQHPPSLTRSLLNTAGPVPHGRYGAAAASHPNLPEANDFHSSFGGSYEASANAPNYGYGTDTSFDFSLPQQQSYVNSHASALAPRYGYGTDASFGRSSHQPQSHVGSHATLSNNLLSATHAAGASHGGFPGTNLLRSSSGVSYKGYTSASSYGYGTDASFCQSLHQHQPFVGSRPAPPDNLLPATHAAGASYDVFPGNSPLQSWSNFSNGSHQPLYPPVPSANQSSSYVTLNSDMSRDLPRVLLEQAQDEAEESGGKSEPHFEEDIKKPSKEYKKPKNEPVQQDAQGKFLCRYNGCAKVYKQVNSMHRHERIHYVGKRYKCDDCDKEFNRNDVKARHVQSCPARKKREREQELRQQLMNQNAALVREAVSRDQGLGNSNKPTDSPTKKHKCDHCGRKFHSSNMKTRHVKKCRVRIAREQEQELRQHQELQQQLMNQNSGSVRETISNGFTLPAHRSAVPRHLDSFQPLVSRPLGFPNGSDNAYGFGFSVAQPAAQHQPYNSFGIGDTTSRYATMTTALHSAAETGNTGGTHTLVYPPRQHLATHPQDGGRSFEELHPHFDDFTAPPNFR